MLLFTRGLLAGGILAFALADKRWRVNYGLDHERRPRTKLAVPYRAKDSPTLRSEFSHPDVVLILTSLSYYYEGLTNDDLFLSFAHLLRSDQAEAEYQEWVNGAAGLDTSFSHLNGVNLKDEDQCTLRIFPCLRFAKAVIDYYTSHLVFAREVREFPHKLTASSWDIGEPKSQPTTGFSGTVDLQKTLPTSVNHHHLSSQEHTNALVISHLLQDDNLVAPVGRSNTVNGTERLVGAVLGLIPPARVILDVGAQVLDNDNHGIASTWLHAYPTPRDTLAVLYFDTTGNLVVLDQSGRVESFQTSPLAKQLDRCLVYLDEAHTRGTDLKLPSHYRAAVTLGPSVTKDKLIQACMRMRKLGQGQTVTFCVSPEVEYQVRRQVDKREDKLITVDDILHWAIHETHKELRRTLPLWAEQGRQYLRQDSLWNPGEGALRRKISSMQATQFLEKEALTLEQRYRPAALVADKSVTNSSSMTMEAIRSRCEEIGNLDHGSAKLLEESVRELSPEIERETHVERPAPAEPAKHSVHPDVLMLVKCGISRRGSPAFLPAFTSVQATTAATHFEVTQFPDALLVTRDFAQTVVATRTRRNMDMYQRAVQWVLVGERQSSSSTSEQAQIPVVIISPYEAEALLPLVRQSDHCSLHIYAPRPNWGFRPLDDLKLHIISSRPGIPRISAVAGVLLNLFAGQLYFDSFHEYLSVCETLSLPAQPYKHFNSDNIHERHAAGQDHRWPTSPVKFLQVFLTQIRQRCESIDKTPLGKVLAGIVLTSDNFPRSRSGKD